VTLDSKAGSSGWTIRWRRFELAVDALIFDMGFAATLVNRLDVAAQ